MSTLQDDYDEMEVMIGEKTYYVSGSYEAEWVDDGIGPYEYWGARGNHHDWCWELSDWSMEVYDEDEKEVTDKEILSKVSIKVGEVLQSMLIDREGPESDPDCD